MPQGLGEKKRTLKAFGSGKMNINLKTNTLHFYTGFVFSQLKEKKKKIKKSELI